jgi:pyruvate dehydrogenase complex dehydrogenase (E1) component
VATLHELAQRGDLKRDAVADAIDRYGIDKDALDPRDA